MSEARESNGALEKRLAETETAAAEDQVCLQELREQLEERAEERLLMAVTEVCAPLLFCAIFGRSTQGTALTARARHVFGVSPLSLSFFLSRCSLFLSVCLSLSFV